MLQFGELTHQQRLDMLHATKLNGIESSEALVSAIQLTIDY